MKDFDTIETAIDHIAAGRAVVAVDSPDRENEGDIIFAAQAATPELMGLTIRHTSGVVCVPITGEVTDRLQLPPMYHTNQDPKGTAYTVSVDAREGVTTGISNADRARTATLLGSPGSVASDLSRPGHIFPLRARDGGVLVRPGHTEAAVDLSRLAGLAPAGVIAEVVNDDGSMARVPELMKFCAEKDLPLITIADLIEYRRVHEQHVSRVASPGVPTRYGRFVAVGYRSTIGDHEYIAFVIGDIGDGQDVLARLHSECLTGDVFGSLRCECGQQLDAALAAVSAAGRGVVVYMRGHEGRGIGLVDKLRAYELQDHGWDTVDANIRLGFPVDSRDYTAGAQILADLGVKSVVLLTNNPAKRSALERYGVPVSEQVPLCIAPNADNRRYLLTKRDRLGHTLGSLPALDTVLAEHSLGNARAPADTPDLEASAG